MSSRSVVLVTLLCATLLAPATAAQPPTQAEVTLSSLGANLLAIDGTPGQLSIRYSIVFPAPVAAGETQLRWALDCPDGAVALTEPQATPVTFTPGQDTYEGTADLAVVAAPSAPGMVELACIVSAVLEATAATSESTGSTAAAMQVAFRAGFDVAPPGKESGGPQKMLHYEVQITNTGNAGSKFTFSILEQPKGKWQVLLPDAVLLPAGERKLVNVAVATPYHNGYVEDGARFVLNIEQEYHFDDGTQPRAEQTLELGAKAEGWYIPGPSPLLVLAAFAMLAIAIRRRV